MRSRNPLFRRFSRLNELQVVDMALSELEQAIQKRTKDPTAVMRRVGLGLQQKIKQIRTSPWIGTDIVRRALSLSSRDRYHAIIEMVLDLRGIRPQIEQEMKERLTREESMKRPTFSERAARPLTIFTTLLFFLTAAAGGGIALHYLYPNGILLTSVEVPQLTGQNLKDTSPDSELFSLNVTYQFDSSTEAGTILSQSPTAGMTRRVSPGRHPCVITLHVSLGPEQVQIGDYVGMTKHQAMTECRRLGLIPKIKQIPDYPSGNVAKSEPSTGEIVNEGSEVVLYVGTAGYVSKVAVPNLVDHSETRAASMLTSLGLVCGGVSYMSSDKPAGTVIAQSILSGTSVKNGTKITLVVSKGKQ